MSMAPQDLEVARAKSQLKSSLLLSLDGTTAIAEDIGRQLVTTGVRMSPEQIERAVDAVTTADIQRVAQKYLWDRDVSCFPRLLNTYIEIHMFRSLLLASVVLKVSWTITGVRFHII